jgi:hypothetical protein
MVGLKTYQVNGDKKLASDLLECGTLLEHIGALQAWHPWRT